MHINIIPTVPWSPWWNEVQQPLDSPDVWNRSTGCRNLNCTRALSRSSRIEDPLRDGLKACWSKVPTAQNIIFIINRVSSSDRPFWPCPDSFSSPPVPGRKTSTSYPKTSPHQISHHQCTDPRIDFLDSPHLESKCSGPLYKDSHPKPSRDRVLTPSRAHISSPLATTREQRPYLAPNRNVTHVIRGSRSWPTKRHILQNKQQQHSPTKSNPVACPRDGPGLFAHWPQSGS